MDYFIGLVCGFFIGLGFGVIGENAAWRDDCSAMGIHRSENIVYECKERK